MMTIKPSKYVIPIMRSKQSTPAASKPSVSPQAATPANAVRKFSVGQSAWLVVPGRLILGSAGSANNAHTTPTKRFIPGCYVPYVCVGIRKHDYLMAFDRLGRGVDPNGKELGPSDGRAVAFDEAERAYITDGEKERRDEVELLRQMTS